MKNSILGNESGGETDIAPLCFHFPKFEQSRFPRIKLKVTPEGNLCCSSEEWMHATEADEREISRWFRFLFPLGILLGGFEFPVAYFIYLATFFLILSWRVWRRRHLSWCSNLSSRSRTGPLLSPVLTHILAPGHSFFCALFRIKILFVLCFR